MRQQNTQSTCIEEKRMTRRVFCVGCKYFKSDEDKYKRRKIIDWCSHPNKDACNHCELYWPKEEMEDK